MMLNIQPFSLFKACIDLATKLLYFFLFWLIAESGATVCRALEVLKEHGARENNIFLVTLFATPRGTKRCLDSFPDITMLTSEIHEQSPTNFGLKYFGSD